MFKKYIIPKNNKKHLKNLCECFNSRSLDGYDYDHGLKCQHTPLEYMFLGIFNPHFSNKRRSTFYRYLRPYVDARTCGHCGKNFIGVPGVNSHDRTFCSEECSKLSRFKPCKCKVCGKIFDSQNSSMFCSLRCSGIARSKSNKAKRKFYVCEKCGKKFSRRLRRDNGSSNKYCSRECAGTGEIGNRKTKRNPLHGSARHRAKYFGVEYENFNTIKIFDIDGWRCRICGRKLNPEDRGTTKKYAPEIDHIVPLSRGGSHTPDNIQSACRRCNLAKSNQSEYGQLVLPIFDNVLV